MNRREDIRTAIVATLVAAGINAYDTPTDAIPEGVATHVGVASAAEQNQQTASKLQHRRTYLLDMDIMARGITGKDAAANSDRLSQDVENAIFANPTMGTDVGIEKLELRDVDFDTREETDSVVHIAKYSVHVIYTTDERVPDPNPTPLLTTEVEYGDPSVRDVISFE